MPGSLVVSQHPARIFSNMAPARAAVRSESSLPSLPLSPRISPASPEGQTMCMVMIASWVQREEVVGQGDALDDVLVALVVPGAGDELDWPRAGERPAAQRGPVAVELYYVTAPFEARFGETCVGGCVGDLCEPVEQIPVLGRTSLERNVSKLQPAGTFARSEGPAFMIFNICDLNAELAA